MDIAAHAALLCTSLHRLTGRHLVDAHADPAQIVALLDAAPFAVVSHDCSADPLFNYANRCALALFEMDWTEFTGLPSRLSAEPLNREERARLLERVTRDGFVSDYSGVRISKNGRRFRIHDATVWNLSDTAGNPRGQAALIEKWEFLD